MITLRDYFGRWEKHEEVTDEIIKNATVLIAKVSTLLSLAQIENVKITSGFRPKSYNKQIGGSEKSWHCFGAAIDLQDPTREIGKWCQTNIRYLMDNGLYMESLSITHKSESPSGLWTHLQSKAPRSGNPIFLP
jgi:uncharacterized protein YcbK (DUF882 family)